MSRVAKLLAELIALPSVNPAVLPAGDPRGGEGRVAEFLAATAARAGLDVEFQAVSPGRLNLLIRQSPSGRLKHRILLAPHLDTVGGDELDERLFTPRRQNGRLYGRGACDTKGSVAAMLTAWFELAKNKRRPKGTEIVFAGLVDEEVGQSGSRALAASGFKADLAIVGEPTRLRVVTAHKGSFWLRLQTRGRAAHGSQPELGRNAIHRMAEVVTLLETTYAAGLRRRRHPLLGHATVSVGTIHGGTQTNAVPARCSITVDRRYLPGETEAQVRREIGGLLRQRGLVATLSNAKSGLCPPLDTVPSLPWVRRFMGAVGQRRPAQARFFCDAAVLAHAGIPSVVFGPGNAAQAHTADEWISLGALERSRAMMGRFLGSLP